MDRKFLIDRGDGEIAGFKNLSDIKREELKVWCSECAIAEGEQPPFTVDGTKLDLPDYSELDGSIVPILYSYKDQHREMQGKDPNLERELSEYECDECSQSLTPE